MCHLGYGDCHLSCKWKFVLLHGELFLRMSCPHHIDMFFTHFMHSCTSVTFILSNYVIVAILVEDVAKVIALSEVCLKCSRCSMLYHLVFKCVIIVNFYCCSHQFH